MLGHFTNLSHHYHINMFNFNFSFESKPSNKIIIIGLLSIIIIPLILMLGVAYGFSSYYDKLLYSRFVCWATVLFTFWYALKVERQPLLVFSEAKLSVGAFILTVFVLYLLSIASGIIATIPRWLGWHENNAMIKFIALLLKGHPIFIIFIAITAGVTEEIVFRGYILTRLLQWLNKPYLAIGISALLFSAMHYRYNSLKELIFTFLIGVLFGAYYFKYRNIKVLICTHILTDIIALSLMQHYKLK